MAQAASTEAVPGPTVLVPIGADWKYLDDGLNQALDWRAPGCDEGAWAEGPAELGYGDADEATVVGYGSDKQNKFATTYFRQAFIVDNASAVAKFLVRFVRDDGAVVYLNGVEICCSNMADGDVLYDDFTIAPVSGDDETASVSGFFIENHLTDGLDVLAVKIHQADGPSSDLSFDLELLAVFEPGPPAVAIIEPADGESLVVVNIVSAVSAAWTRL
jgi:alkylation response protein AidB-like acyl-CoA dehydrogenase